MLLSTCGMMRKHCSKWSRKDVKEKPRNGKSGYEVLQLTVEPQEQLANLSDEGLDF